MLFELQKCYPCIFKDAMSLNINRLLTVLNCPNIYILYIEVKALENAVKFYTYVSPLQDLSC